MNLVVLWQPLDGSKTQGAKTNYFSRVHLKLTIYFKLIMRDELIDEVLTSLKIIGSIKEGQKVCVRNGLLVLEQRSNGFLPALKRFIYGDNREITIRYIKNVVHNAISILNAVNNDEIRKHLNEAVVGLQRLEVTYVADIATVSGIQVLVTRIQHEIESRGLAQ